MNINEKVSQPEGPIKAWEDSDFIEKNKTFVSSPFNEKLFKEPEPEPEPEPEVSEPEQDKKGGKTAKGGSKEETETKPKEVAEKQDKSRPKGLITKREKKPPTTPEEVSAKSSTAEKKLAKETAAKKAAP